MSGVCLHVSFHQYWYFTYITVASYYNLFLGATSSNPFLASYRPIEIFLPLEPGFEPTTFGFAETLPIWAVWAVIRRGIITHPNKTELPLHKTLLHKWKADLQQWLIYECWILNRPTSNLIWIDMWYVLLSTQSR